MDADINDLLIDLRSAHPMDKRYSIMHFSANLIEQLTAECDELRAALEIERMRLAGCGVAAMSNNDESVKARINNLSPFWSASYGDVCAAVDREMSLRKQLAALQANREPLSDDEIRDCAESENLPYFENKEEFDAFTRAIEAAHGIGVNDE